MIVIVAVAVGVGEGGGEGAVMDRSREKVNMKTYVHNCILEMIKRRGTKEMGTQGDAREYSLYGVCVGLKEGGAIRGSGENAYGGAMMAR